MANIAAAMGRCRNQQPALFPLLKKFRAKNFGRGYTYETEHDNHVSSECLLVINTAAFDVL